MDKKPFEKWLYWLLGSLGFLLIVHILFTIKAPHEWLEAKWTAGDVISFAGTIVLGFIAISQTQFANQMNQKILEMQRQDYLPLITITGMVGMSKDRVNYVSEEFYGKFGIYEIRDDDNEVYLGYAVAFKIEPFDFSKPFYCRTYEIQYKYNGKCSMRSLSINTVSVVDNAIKEVFTVEHGNDLMSLTPGEEHRLFFFFVSNEDFSINSNKSHQIIVASQIVLNITMTDFDGKEHNEEITIKKHLIKEAERRFNRANVEFPVSVSYAVG